MNENPAQYFKYYRESIGFSNQGAAKQFLAGKDILSGVDFQYIESLNSRLVEIVAKIKDTYCYPLFFKPSKTDNNSCF